MALASLAGGTSHSLKELFYEAYARSHGHVTIGRGPDCVLVIAGQQSSNGNMPLMLSRNHAKLAVMEGHLQLWDCGSVNGTWVNTQQIQKKAWRVLQDGDVLTFGGPPEIKQNGQLQPNPWRFKVRHLHEFLASYTPTTRPAQQQEPVQPEVFRFTAAASDRGPQAAILQGRPAQEGEPGVALQDPTQEVFRFGGHPVAAGDDGGAVAPHGPADGLAVAAATPLDRLPAPLEALPAACSPSVQPGRRSELPPLAAPVAAEPAGAGAQEGEGSAAAAADAAAMQPQPEPQDQEDAGVQQALQPVRRAPASDVDFIDLTMDDSPPRWPQVSPRALPHRWRQPHPSVGRATRTDSGPQAAVVLGVSPAQAGLLDEVSPPKRREQGSAQMRAAHHKRPKPSKAGPGMPKPAYIKVDDEAAGPSGHAAVPAAGAGPGSAAGGAAAGQEAQAAAVPHSAGGAGASGSDLAAIHSQFICAICQELVVHCVSTVPCGHYFCGECLAGWLANKKECPTCRAKNTAAPVWNAAIDSICNDVLEKQLGKDDLEERQRKKQAWDANKAQLERALQAPWEPQANGGRGDRDRGGRGGQRAGDGGGLLAAMMQMVAEGGPLVPPELLFGDPLGMGMDFAPPQWGARGRQGPRRAVQPPSLYGVMLPGRDVPAGVGAPRGPGERPPMPGPPPPPPRHVPLPPPPQPQHQFKAEYGRRATPCAGCFQPLEPNTVRIGVAPTPTNRSEAQNPAYGEWYHVDCVPPHYWAESRTSGILNMRGVSPADQSRIRQYQMGMQ